MHENIRCSERRRAIAVAIGAFAGKGTRNMRILCVTSTLATLLVSATLLLHMRSQG